MGSNKTGGFLYWANFAMWWSSIEDGLRSTGLSRLVYLDPGTADHWRQTQPLLLTAPRSLPAGADKGSRPSRLLSHPGRGSGGQCPRHSSGQQIAVYCTVIYSCTISKLQSQNCRNMGPKLEVLQKTHSKQQFWGHLEDYGFRIVQITTVVQSANFSFEVVQEISSVQPTNYSCYVVKQSKVLTATVL